MKAVARVRAHARQAEAVAASLARGTEVARPAAVVLAAAVLASGCWRTGEPTPGDALVTWAAYPDTVVAGELFSLEFAGPVAPNQCARLDTAVIEVGDSVVTLSARRSTFETMCADQAVSFYEARPLRVEAPGRYRVLTADGLELGELVVVDSGRFSPVRASGYGTVRSAGGCWVFGPGWAANQRPFALRDAPPELRAEAGTRRVVYVRGRLRGFQACGWYGSRPAIAVDSVAVTERTTADYYGDVETADDGGGR